jgi:hypothetical protein
VKRCPRLVKELEAGRIRLEDQEYIGKAADGVEVKVGTLGYESRLEEYLITHPDPMDW